MPTFTKAAEHYTAQLRRLHRLHKGVCQCCRRPTGMWWQYRRRGWFLHGDWIVSPTGGRIRTATVEHVLAVRDGGTDDAANLTLYCAECNRRKD